MRPDRTHLGDRGPAVEAGQRWLVAEGYDPGPVDGAHGPRTEAAWVASEAPPTLRTGGVRERMLAVVRATVGLHQLHDRDAFVSLLAGPGDGPAQLQMFGSKATSTCALVARGWLRRLGVRHPLLESAYRTGHAMEDLETIGRDLGAWVAPTGGAMPRPGDVVVLDSASGGHAYAVELVEGPLIESIDGGQHEGARLGDGPQFIARMRRRWRAGRRGWIDVGVTSRAVRGWIDVERVGA